MQKFAEHNGKEQEAIRIIRALLLGAAFGTAICAAMLALSAMILVKAGTLPEKALPILTVFIGAVSAFFSGYITVSAYKKRGLLLGCIAGFVIFFIILIIGIANNTDSNLANALTKGIIMTVTGGIGGVVKVNKKKKAKRY